METPTLQEREDTDVRSLASALARMSEDEFTQVARVMVRQHRHTGHESKPARPLAMAFEVLDALK